MTFEEFKSSLKHATPPSQLNIYLKALWYDGKDDWDMSHQIAQDINDNNGSWIHAYLHRKEGDTSNPGYWYHRAKKQMPSHSLQDEWKQLVEAMI